MLLWQNLTTQQCTTILLKSIFGTNNKFNYKDVINRWSAMEKMASEFGIKILGYLSDDDTRLLKAMQISTYNQQSTQYYVQDTVHIGTSNLRTKNKIS